MEYIRFTRPFRVENSLCMSEKSLEFETLGGHSASRVKFHFEGTVIEFPFSFPFHRGFVVIVLREDVDRQAWRARINQTHHLCLKIQGLALLSHECAHSLIESRARNIEIECN